jgi:hypothetical protein
VNQYVRGVLQAFSKSLTIQVARVKRPFWGSHSDA